MSPFEEDRALRLRPNQRFTQNGVTLRLISVTPLLVIYRAEGVVDGTLYSAGELRCPRRLFEEQIARGIIAPVKE